ncbi:MAG: ABC transporter permease [Candidatus Heimdallarchaeota archaeon]
MSEDIVQSDEIVPTPIELFIRKLKTFFRPVGNSARRISNQIGGLSLGFFRSPGLIFLTIVLPIILTLLFGSLFGSTIDTNYQLDVLDKDQSDASIQFTNYLTNNTGLIIEVLEDTSINPVEWLKENTKTILLEIPMNWGAYINNSVHTDLKVYYDHSSSSAKTTLKLIEEAVIELNFEILAIENTLGVETDNLYVTHLSFIDSLVPGIIMISVSTIALITNLSYDLNEKHSGILRKFVTTPVFKFEWVFAKQFWQIILAFLASTLTVLFALIFDFQATNLHPAMLVMIIYGSLTFSGIAMILVRLISNPDGVMLASVLFTIPQILLSGALIPIDTFPVFLQYVARIFPIYYLTEGMRALMLGPSQGVFWVNFSISTVMAIGFFVMGIIVTKWKQE